MITVYKNTQLFNRTKKNLSIKERLLNYLIGAWFWLFGIPMICYTYHYIWLMFNVIFTFLDRKPISHFFQKNNSNNDFLGFYFGWTTLFLILCSTGYFIFYCVYKRKQKKKERRSLQSSFPIS